MDDARTRVLRDARLLRAVRAHYRGRGDVLDVLWWADHPGVPTPQGLPDPATALEEARRSLYRPNDDERHDPARIALEVAAHRADVEAARQAVREADADRTGRPSGVPLRAGVLAVIAAAVAVGGFAAGRAIPGPAARTQPPEATSAPSLEIFDRRQQPAADLPAEADALPSFLDPGSVRQLRSYSTIGTVVYAARTQDALVCMFVVVLGEPSTPACITETAFAEGGLTLLTRASADPVDDSGRRPTEELEITWNPNRTVSITPVATSS